MSEDAGIDPSGLWIIVSGKTSLLSSSLYIQNLSKESPSTKCLAENRTYTSRQAGRLLTYAAPQFFYNIVDIKRREHIVKEKEHIGKGKEHIAKGKEHIVK